MPRRLLAAVAVLALLTTACGGSDDGDAASDGADTTVAADGGDDGGDDSGGDDGGGGDIDCATILAAAEGLGLPLQILAQLRTTAQYDLVKDGTLVFVPAETLDDIEAMRPLQDVDIPAGVTSTTVEEALDLYEEATTLAQQNLAVDDPFTEAQGEELVALTQDTGAFLGGQAAIAFALDEAGCT
jgi:ABC-type glycerol-3-phosphate transport system substrate-binding protein